ncbi:MAG: DUF1564 family protein [Spirochaetales bacterium]|nr:DUF1564 family protein [Leptospiraceae bacterium]MCP5481298.1 DUF1564 family protein [Spirochaetales bacterium]MCP5485734.1 DUF1564 family protein [Spirochaetales bacterium]
MKRKLDHWKTQAIEPGRPACTFLIPADLEVFLRKRRDDHRWVISYLEFLIGQALRYRAEGRLPEVPRVTRRYQADDPTIQRWHVRVPGELWTELRCLAGSCGVTMCNMFVILIRLDQQDQVRVPKNVGASSCVFGYRIVFLQSVCMDEGITRRSVVFEVSSDPPKCNWAHQT